MFKNKKECMDFMEGLVGQAEELLRVLGDAPARLPVAQVARARELSRDFKSKLKEYYKLHQTERAKKALHPIEKAYCLPAVHKAMCEIRVTPNHRPSAQWFHEVFSAQDELRYYLDQLKG